MFIFTSFCLSVNLLVSKVTGLRARFSCVNGDYFKDHLSTHGCLTSLRNRPLQSNLGNFQHQYLPELLVNVYSYYVMMNNVSCFCACGSKLLSNSEKLTT